MVFMGSTAQSLLRFGLPIVAVNIVSILAQNLDYLVVGRYLGAEALGVYTLAFRIPELILLQFCVIIAQVIFPIFTKIRDDTEALRRGFLETARYVALFTVPIGLGMALLAEPFIVTFFGEKWLDAAPVMRAISLYGLFISLGYNAGDVYKAQGQPGMLTRISILHVLLLAPPLLFAVRYLASIVAVGWVQAFIALVVSIVYLAVALKMLDLSIYRLVNSLKTPFVPALGLTAAVTATVYLSSGMAPWIQLIAGVVAGGIAYIGLLCLLEREVVAEAIRLLHKVLVR
jgi:PST family polysaccharide transporter